MLSAVIIIEECSPFSLSMFVNVCAIDGTRCGFAAENRDHWMKKKPTKQKEQKTKYCVRIML